MNDDLSNFLIAALEASILHSPRDHGLTQPEIVEAAGSVGFRPGEVSDAIARLRLPTYYGQERIRLANLMPFHLSADFNDAFEPDYRDIRAFEFVRQELKRIAAELGESQAALPRDVLVERGVAKGLSRHNVEVAITVTALSGIFEESDGIVKHAPGRLGWVLPSVQFDSRQHHSHSPAFKRKWATVAHPIVKDIVGRRTDGRGLHASGLDALGNHLNDLGYHSFGEWWVSHTRELRTLEGAMQATSIVLLSATLAQAALSFIVPRAKAQGLMQQIEGDSPAHWVLSDLIDGSTSAGHAGDSVLDDGTVRRCRALADLCAKISGNYLIDAVQSEHHVQVTSGQAREAQEALELLARAVLDWLQRSTSPKLVTHNKQELRQLAGLRRPRWTHPAMRDLRDALLHAYEQLPAARHLAQTAGIDLRNWNERQAPFPAWNDLLELAMAQGKLSHLVKQAVEDPSILAYHDDLRAFLDVHVTLP